MISKLLVAYTNQPTLIALQLLLLTFFFRCGTPRPWQAHVLMLKLFDHLFSTFLTFDCFKLLIYKIFFDSSYAGFLRSLFFLLGIVTKAAPNFNQSGVRLTYCIRAEYVAVHVGIPLFIL